MCQRRSLRILLRRIKRPRRQLRNIERVPGNVPVHLVSRNKIQAPRLYPADPTRLGRLSGIRRITRRQRLESPGKYSSCARSMLQTASPPAARKPQPSSLTPPRTFTFSFFRTSVISSAGANAIATSAPSGRSNAAYVTANVNPNAARPARPFLEFRRAPHRHRNRKQRRPLRQWICRIHRRKRTKGRQPQRAMRSAPAEPQPAPHAAQNPPAAGILPDPDTICTHAAAA